MIPPDELQHLSGGASPTEHPGGVGLATVIAICADANTLLDRLREVMTPVVAHQQGAWPSVDRWSTLVPAWFVDACADELSPQESTEWLRWWQSLSADEQRRSEQEQRWSLADWLHWMEPDNRTWYWWDAVAECSNRVRLLVEVNGWPAAFGPLNWLMRAAGAESVSLDDELRPC